MKKLLFLLTSALLFLYCGKEQVSIVDPLCEENEQIPNVPILISPPCGASLDNGCRSNSRSMTWHFDWDDYPGAIKYHILIMHGGASLSLVDDEVFIAEFTLGEDYRGGGYIASHNLKYWFWKVRAFVDGNWTEWSEKRFFHVKRPDC